MKYLIALILTITLVVTVYAEKPRFKYKKGTMEDTKTELVWLGDADCFGEINYWLARHEAMSLEDGVCGLSDRSEMFQWRLPTVEDLHGLGTNPPLEFYSPLSDDEWSNPLDDAVYWAEKWWCSTSRPDTCWAMVVNMETGNSYGISTDNGNHFIAVRDK